MSAARKFCEASLTRRHAMTQGLRHFVRGTGETTWRALQWTGLFVALGYTLLLSGWAAYGPQDPFVLPLTAWWPLLGSLSLSFAGFTGPSSWRQIPWPHALLPWRWRQFKEWRKTQCAYFSLGSEGTDSIDGADCESAGLAFVCALAQTLAKTGRQPCVFSWQKRLLDPEERWVLCVAVQAAPLDLHPIHSNYILLKVQAIRRYNSDPENKPLTRAVFHVDNEDDVEKAWRRETGEKLRFVSQTSGRSVAQAGSLRFISCENPQDFVDALEDLPHPGAFRRFITAFLVAFVVAAFLPPGGRDPELAPTCDLPGKDNIGGTKVVELGQDDEGRCTVAIKSFGYRGPVEIYFEPIRVGAGDAEIEALQASTLEKIPPKQSIPTYQEAVIILLRRQRDPSSKFYMAHLTIGNRAGRSSAISILFRNKDL